MIPATARDQLVAEHVHNVGFIAYNIGRKLPANIEMDDLIQAGMLGLIDAASKFDVTRENTFKTYAEFRIRGAILDYLRAQDLVPRSIRDQCKAYEATVANMTASLGRTPFIHEIAAVLEITPDEVFELQALFNPITILEMGVVSDFTRRDRASLLEILTGGETATEKMVNKIHHKRMLEKIAAYIAVQPPRDYVLLESYFFVGLTLFECGKIIRVGESRCSQLLKRHVIRIRQLVAEFNS